MGQKKEKKEKGLLLLRSLFGGACSKMEEDAPSPSPSPAMPRRLMLLPSSFTLVSCSDIISSSTNTTSEDLSSLSSSVVLGANLHVFTLAEMTAATNNFAAPNFVGKGGFGPVYKGHVHDGLRPGVLKPQMVAVKVLDLEGVQGHREWLTEVMLLGQLRHPNLVKLIGYCYEDKHRLLVYEFMARGSLENCLFKKYFETLPWDKRIKIAVGAARGLEFLHGMEPPVIYRDFKASNILLDSEFKAKLSDFGLAKDGPQGDQTHVSTRIMGTHGYAAPEYVMTGHLTTKSDVYSFGVVLLELLTGRPSVDKSRPSRGQNLVDWARPYLNDSRKLGRLIDLSLEGQYPMKGVQKVAALAYHCLSQLPKSRPNMSMVVQILEPILHYNDGPMGTFVFTIKENEGVEKVKVMEDEMIEKIDDPSVPCKGDERGNLLEAKEREDGHENRRQLNCRRTAKISVCNHQRHHCNGGCRRRHSLSKPVHYTDTALYTKPSRKQDTHNT